MSVILRDGSSKQWRLAIAGGTLLASLTAAVIAVAVPHSPNREEQNFLATVDAVRTALAVYYVDSCKQGHPSLPTALSQLGPDMVPPDPWTGVADWGTVRNSAGEIIGIYSRSGHAVRDVGRLAGLAQLRNDLSLEQVAVLGVSAWIFKWEPPAGSQRLAQRPLQAVDALNGAWPPDVMRRQSVANGGDIAPREPGRDYVRIVNRTAHPIIAAEEMVFRDRLVVEAESPEQRGSVRRAANPNDAGLSGPHWNVYVPMSPARDAGDPGDSVAGFAATAEDSFVNPQQQYPASERVFQLAGARAQQEQELPPFRQDPERRRLNACQSQANSEATICDRWTGEDSDTEQRCRASVEVRREACESGTTPPPLDSPI